MLFDSDKRIVLVDCPGYPDLEYKVAWDAKPVQLTGLYTINDLAADERGSTLFVYDEDDGEWAIDLDKDDDCIAAIEC